MRGRGASPAPQGRAESSGISSEESVDLESGKSKVKTETEKELQGGSGDRKAVGQAHWGPGCVPGRLSRLGRRHGFGGEW